MKIKAIACSIIVFHDECEIELDQFDLDNISDIVNNSDEDDIESAVYEYICNCYAGTEAVDSRNGNVDESYIDEIDYKIINDLISKLSNCCKRNKNKGDYNYCPQCGCKLN